MPTDIDQQLERLARALDERAPLIRVDEARGGSMASEGLAGLGDIHVANGGRHKGLVLAFIAITIAIVGGLAAVLSTRADSPRIRTAPPPTNTGSAISVAPVPSVAASAPTTSVRAPATAPADDLTGEAFFSPDCLADDYESARSGGRVPVAVAGARSPFDVTGYHLGDPATGEGDPNRSAEWISVAAGSPRAVVGFQYSPNDDLLNGPAGTLIGGCHPEAAIYDEDGVLIGRFLQSLPQTIHGLAIPPKVNVDDDRGPIERLIGVPADAEAATWQWHALAQQAISECMEQAGFVYIPLELDSATNPNNDTLLAMSTDEAAEFNEALYGGATGGCEREAAAETHVGNALPAHADLQAGIEQDESVLLAMNQFSNCLSQAGLTRESAPPELLDQCSIDAGVPAALTAAQERLEPAFANDHIEFFAGFLANLERLRSNAATQLIPRISVAPDGRTYGRMPAEVGSGTDIHAIAPDFIAVLTRDGSEVAGYASKLDLFSTDRGREYFDVYAQDLTTIVGRWYYDIGFVAQGEDPDAIPQLVTVTSVAPPTRCEAAPQAVEGHGGLADLPDSPGLLDEHRNPVAGAVARAQDEIDGGDGWDNTELVDLVNELCGLQLTPVTMVP